MNGSLLPDVCECGLQLTAREASLSQAESALKQQSEHMEAAAQLTQREAEVSQQQSHRASTLLAIHYAVRSCILTLFRLRLARCWTVMMWRPIARAAEEAPYTLSATARAVTKYTHQSCLLGLYGSN
jgi:hypothetical protein